MTDIDPEQLALAELAEMQVPAPEDLVDGLTPAAKLLYLERLSYVVLAAFAVAAADAPTTAGPEFDSAAGTLGALNLVCGEIDAACAPLGLLPEGWDAVEAPG